MYVIWEPNPVALQFGSFAIRWYGILFALGFYLAYLIFERTMLLDGKTHRQARQVLLCMIVGTAIGGRLGHCFFYHPNEYLAQPLRVLDFRDGGNSSHGATFLLVLTIFIYTRAAKSGFRWLCDRLCVAIGLSAAFVRFGNLMNSEILGRPTGAAWGFVFERVDAIPRHPAVLYEATAYFVILGMMVWLYYRTEFKRYPGRLWGVFFLMVFGSRLVVDYFKDAAAVIDWPLPLAMTQVLCVPCIVLGAGLTWASSASTRQIPTLKPRANEEFN